ncbi:MAG TPA: hypothetical protein PKL31_04125 [Fulvivirga sp.]|nr:hypothetical protein [Fulvivirga sp.]
MAYLTKRQFADKCGISTSELSVYISRNKVIITSQGLIDDADEFNEYFYLRRTTDNDITDESNEFLQLDYKKKSLDIQKITEEIEILKIKKDKTHSEVIPTNMIDSLIKEHSKSLSTSFEKALDRILIKISDKRTLTLKEKNCLKSEVLAETKIINNRVMQTTQKELKQIVVDFSETRGRGERV